MGRGVDGIIRRENEVGNGFIAAAPMRESLRPSLHHQVTPLVADGPPPAGGPPP